MRVPFIPFVQGRNDYDDTDGAKYGLAWHNTSNNASDTAEAAYGARRTDGVSSHFYVDQDSATQSIDTADRCGHAGSKNGNENAVCFELTGANGWTRAQWLANIEWDLLGRVAAAVIRAHWPDGSFQNRRATVAEMQANPKIKAHYGHDDMRRAWGGTTHTDPGPGFPWDHLCAVVQAALDATVEDSGMYCKFGDIKSPNVETLQRRLLRLGAPKADGKPFTTADLDRTFGADTAAGLASIVGGNGRNFGPLEVEALDHVYAVRFGAGPGAKGDQGDQGPKGDKGDKGDSVVLSPGTRLTVESVA